MDRNKLLQLSSEWSRFAKNDIRKKLKDFMNETGMDASETAAELAISEGEIEQILSGSGEMSFSTFAKLLIASGFVIEVKPLRATPFGSYDNIPMPPPMGAPMPYGGIPFPNEERRQAPRNAQRRYVPQFGNDEESDEFTIEDESSAPQRQRPQYQCARSPFRRMSREQMVKIIKNRLWDTEIDLDNASWNGLATFLEEKDSKVQALKENANRNNENEGANEFKKRLAQALEKNPHLMPIIDKLIK